MGEEPVAEANTAKGNEGSAGKRVNGIACGMLCELHQMLMPGCGVLQQAVTCTLLLKWSVVVLEQLWKTSALENRHWKIGIGKLVS